ncbi:MAG TPA: PAS domain S-box protein [Ideonella sp.]|uniref:hybrid sensor histidine kinase/response regulator n=1 Tax=Ideonella sp. TaxID=1929293 RepID=UPI002E35F2FE|nr:PAS domain S-box protein [Ideonella sp.]HEX5688307.1 PAS domain S-box protein [Ideonella sp.]
MTTPETGSAAPRSDEVFRRLVDSVHDYAIFMLSPDGHIVSWNQGAQRIKGYSAPEAIGQHFSVFYPPEAVQSGWPQEELRRAVAAGRFEDEGWRIRKDGTRFWANVVISPLRDDAGMLLGFAKVTRDLTDRKRQEQRVADSERHLRLLIESVQDYAIFMLDPQGIVASWNPGAQRIKGYSAEEVIGRPFTIFYPQEAIDKRWPEEELRRARQAGRFEDEGWRVHKDGTLIWANVVITAVKDERGELVGFSKVTRDLTERRRHEEQLKDSEERLRLIVEGVKDHAMFLLDVGGIIRSWNQAARTVLGYTQEDAIGQDVAMLYAPEDRQAGRPEAERSAAAHGGSFQSEGWKMRADGTRLWTDVVITAVRDQSGALQGFVHILRDMTEQRRAETLEAEGKRVLEFIAMLSHELRNPLAPIQNAVSILKSPIGKQQTDRCADLIGRQVNHLTRLVDDLLDVSRITTGKIELQQAPLEMNTLVQVAFDSMRATLESYGHSCELKLAPQPAFINGDSVRLTQVVVNLLTNAAKYTPPNGHVELCVARDRSVVRLEVSDNGVGMPESLLQRAFDPFVQGPRSLDRSAGGLGIGLTLVRKIVDLHGGTVVAASEGAGRGAKFTVTLPLSMQASQPVDGTTVMVHPATGGRVLLVDDNDDAAESLALLLQMSGHEVLMARSGAEALSIAAREQLKLGVVLLDLGLPDMSGYEVARRLRDSPLTRHLRLIATTGYGQESDRRATAEAGFDEHLVKPVNHHDVLRLIA